MKLPFENRQQAGQALAQALAYYRDFENVLVLALPRGGVPVAAEVAQALQAQFDLILVRKLGAPGQAELAIGAIASGGIRVLNKPVIYSLGIFNDTIEKLANKEHQELLRREKAYRSDRPMPDIRNKTVILVDDGIATGATMRAAIAALRTHHPARIIVAVPVAPADTVEVLRKEADEVCCLAMPSPFMAIGNYYIDFAQLTDEEVLQELHQVWHSVPS